MSIRLTPPPERVFPAGRLQQRKEQLVSELYGASAAPSQHHPRRILVLAAAFAVAGILAAAGYAGFKLTRPRNTGRDDRLLRDRLARREHVGSCLRYAAAGCGLFRHLCVRVPELAAARELRRLRASQRLDRRLPERRKERHLQESRALRRGKGAGRPALDEVARTVQKRPSCSAGAATAGSGSSSGSATAAGWAPHPRSSGRRAKSASSTFSIAGV